MRRFASCVLVVGIVWLGIFPVVLTAESASQKDPLAVRPVARILSPIDDDQRVILRGNRHPVTASTAAAGPVASGKLLQHMVLVLRPSPEQQQALDKLVAAQQDPASPYYHRWLTPESYAQRFGIAGNDLEQIEDWLRRQGLKIDEVSAGKRSILFSGSVGEVEAAFHTSLRYYPTGSTRHLANATDPEVPAAIAGVVEGVASLHDFFSRPLVEAQSIQPEYTTGSAHYLSPADFATIYDVRSLYNQGYDGTGQTVAIVARSNITQSDVTMFRSQFSLPANAPHVILVNTDPGTGSGDFGEAMLDVEWSGAVAKGATIDFVAASSTAVSDGVLLSAQYIVNHNLAPVMSMSYGLCETDMGSAENTWVNSLWQQAVSQGISVFVSAGDSGAAGCDSASATRATGGKAVNGLCTSPYSTCVGGTEFDDTSQSHPLLEFEQRRRQQLGPELHPGEGVERVGQLRPVEHRRRGEPDLQQAQLAECKRCACRWHARRARRVAHLGRPRCLHGCHVRQPVLLLRHLGCGAIVCRHHVAGSAGARRARRRQFYAL